MQPVAGPLFSCRLLYKAIFSSTLADCFISGGVPGPTSPRDREILGIPAYRQYQLPIFNSNPPLARPVFKYSLPWKSHSSTRPSFLDFFFHKTGEKNGYFNLKKICILFISRFKNINTIRSCNRTGKFKCNFCCEIHNEGFILIEVSC